MKWLDDQVSPEHRTRVLRAAEAEMARHQTVKAFRFDLWRLAGAAVAAGIAFLVFKNFTGPEKSEAPMELAENDLEMLEGLSMIENLDLLVNLDAVENWKPPKEG